MRVYIPFDDGSVVSYDGMEFKLHRQPVGIDADVRALPESEAGQAWRARRKDLVRALEDAWWREQTLRRKKSMKRIYSRHERQGEEAQGEKVW